MCITAGFSNVRSLGTPPYPPFRVTQSSMLWPQQGSESHRAVCCGHTRVQNNTEQYSVATAGFIVTQSSMLWPQQISESHIAVCCGHSRVQSTLNPNFRLAAKKHDKICIFAQLRQFPRKEYTFAFQSREQAF